MVKLYVLVGLPASGKSTMAQHMVGTERVSYVSRDHVRSMYVAVNGKRDERAIKKKYMDMIETTLELGISCIADATNLSKNKRESYFQLARKLRTKGIQVEVHAIYMEADLETCIYRNSLREQGSRVPDYRIIEMSKSVDIPSNEEGYTNIHYIDKENDYYESI